MLIIIILIVSIILKISAVFRLTIPVIYILVVPTVFSSWSQAHPQIANGIFYALLALTALSWVISFVRKVQDLLWQHRENKRLAESI